MAFFSFQFIILLLLQLYKSSENVVACCIVCTCVKKKEKKYDPCKKQKTFTFNSKWLSSYDFEESAPRGFFKPGHDTFVYTCTCT